MKLEYILAVLLAAGCGNLSAEQKRYQKAFLPSGIRLFNTAIYPLIIYLFQCILLQCFLQQVFCQDFTFSLMDYGVSGF